MFRVYCEDTFTTKDTKSTKFGVLIIRTLRVLRVLRALRGEQNKLNVTAYPHKSLKNLLFRRAEDEAQGS